MDKIDKMIMDLIGSDFNSNDNKSDQAEEKPSPAEQRDSIREYLAKPIDFKVGDEVRLNKFGCERYTWPRKGDVAIVSEVFSVPVFDEEGYGLVHGTIVSFRQNRTGGFGVAPANVDFRSFEKVTND